MSATSSFTTPFLQTTFALLERRSHPVVLRRAVFSQLFAKVAPKIAAGIEAREWCMAASCLLLSSVSASSSEPSKPSSSSASSTSTSSSLAEFVSIAPLHGPSIQDHDGLTEWVGRELLHAVCHAQLTDALSFFSSAFLTNLVPADLQVGVMMI
jgi:hypothetical protein